MQIEKTDVNRGYLAAATLEWDLNPPVWW